MTGSNEESTAANEPAALVSTIESQIDVRAVGQSVQLPVKPQE